jgi:pimeloyl-ACP methyl ester carboxylesterase
MAVQRRQTLIGSLSQMAAATTHYCTPEKLRRIDRSIPKIWILTGDEDNLIYPSNSFWLHKHMPEAEFEQWTHSGHGLVIQYPERFNERLDKVIQEAKRRIAAGGAP